MVLTKRGVSLTDHSSGNGTVYARRRILFNEFSDCCGRAGTEAIIKDSNASVIKGSNSDLEHVRFTLAAPHILGAGNENGSSSSPQFESPHRAFAQALASLEQRKNERSLTRWALHREVVN